MFQHWLLSETEVSDEQRKRISDEWTGAAIVTRDVPDDESWAPAWWKGDEDATVTARMAAMTLDASRNRR